MSTQIRKNLQVFITEYSGIEGLYAGPNIRAYTWLEAEGIVNRIEGVVLIGKLSC